MRRNLRFILLLMKLKLQHMMVFRLNFFGAFFADGMLFITQLLAFNVIYSQVDSIGGWSRGQMLIFVGTFSMLNGLNMLIYFFGVINIPGLIRSGGLDMYIVKPVNALLRLTFEQINPGSFPLLILSGMIVAYGVSVSGVRLSALIVLAYIVLVLLMTLLYYDMEVILRTLPFFFISTSAVDSLEGELLTFNFKIPGVLFKGIFKIIFYFVLPYGVMATVPAQLLSGTLSIFGLLHALAIVVVFTVFALWFWRLGMKHYKSASS